jgi:voltage-gated potassium channel
MNQPHPPHPERQERLGPGPAEWQKRWYDVIFEHDTFAGRTFDYALFVVIFVSVIAVMLESIQSYREAWRFELRVVEWIITVLFTIEVIARLACVNRPARYLLSFFGVVDIISLLPSYLMFFLPGAQSLATIRTVRLLRIFRVLKLAHHVREGQTWLLSLKRTWPKITVFITVIMCTIVILGSVMYLVEGNADSGFDNIPESVYWAIVTLTTVGYGDIAPATPLGKIIASFVMLLGYAIIIVPIGLFSAEVMSQRRPQDPDNVCTSCGFASWDVDPNFCSKCGEPMEPSPEEV